MNWIRFVLWCVVALALLPILALAEEDRSIAIHGVEGHGKSRQLALADAFRNAIGQALGTYVVTSRQWDGEALDKKIFDNSDAVVKTHRVVDEKESGGRWSVTIDAEIVRNEMMKFIRREAAVKVDEGELANLLAKRNAINNAVKSLELLFQNWRENIYRVEKCGRLSISASDNMGDVVHVSVPFIISFRWDSYNIFLDKVRNVLSRIAIDKTKGEYDTKDDRDFLKKNYLFYSRVGLAHKTDGGDIQTTGNPNQYAEIRVISCSSETKMVYEIFIVPYQVKACMASLLNHNVVVRCAFTSKGGEVVSKSLISGEVYSFGWSEICDDVVGLGWRNAEFEECLTVMDKIQTDFHGEQWSERRLYHASVPVPLDAASRISSCTLTICPLSEDDNCIQGYDAITTETMNADEWLRIDNKPKIETPSRTTVTKANAAPSVKNARQLYLVAMATSNDVDRQQAYLRASAAGLIACGKIDIYKKHIKGKLQNVAEFEDGLKDDCEKCSGAGTKERRCYDCKGEGKCPRCKGSGETVRVGFDNNYETRPCRKCKGEGRCPKCGGEGSIKEKCFACAGTGKVFSKTVAARVFRDSCNAIADGVGMVASQNNAEDNSLVNVKPEVAGKAVGSKECPSDVTKSRTTRRQRRESGERNIPQ